MASLHKVALSDIFKLDEPIAAHSKQLKTLQKMTSLSKDPTGLSGICADVSFGKVDLKVQHWVAVGQESSLPAMVWTLSDDKAKTFLPTKYLDINCEEIIEGVSEPESEGILLKDADSESLASEASSSSSDLEDFGHNDAGLLPEEIVNEPVAATSEEVFYSVVASGKASAETLQGNLTKPLLAGRPQSQMQKMEPPMKEEPPMFLTPFDTEKSPEKVSGESHKDAPRFRSRVKPVSGSARKRLPKREVDGEVEEKEIGNSNEADYDELYLNPQQSSVDVNVRNLTGETFTLDVRLSDLVDDVKARIQDRTGMPLDGQRLIVNGLQLRDGRSLSDYNIKTGSTINLVLMYDEISGRRDYSNLFLDSKDTPLTIDVFVHGEKKSYTIDGSSSLKDLALRIYAEHKWAKDWNVQEVASFLNKIGLAMYQEAFSTEGVDGEVLLDLDADGVMELGVKALHRKKLLRHIEELRGSSTS